MSVKEVCIKKERTGEWYASFAVEGKQETPKPENPDRCIGIDVGILKYAHNTDGRAVGSLEFEMDRDANAALNILSRGFESLGLGLGQSEDTTPVETALPMFTSSGCSDVVDGMESASSKQEAPPSRSQLLLASRVG